MITNKQIQIKQKKQTKSFAKNIKTLKIVTLLFLGVIVFVMANVFNNRWGREITEMEHQIQVLETKIEYSKIKNQELSNKTRLERKTQNSLNMHYNVDSNVVVEKFD